MVEVEKMEVPFKTLSGRDAVVIGTEGTDYCTTYMPCDIDSHLYYYRYVCKDVLTGNIFYLSSWVLDDVLDPEVIEELWNGVDMEYVHEIEWTED